MYIQRQIDQKAYKADGFIGMYKNLVASTVIPYQYKILNDNVPGVPKSHVAANFISAACVLEGKEPPDDFYGFVFQDSDAAKWIEAAAYSLWDKPNKSLEKNADELITLIAKAQDKDGYLDTAFTVKDRNMRWQDLMYGHELYCSGHMIEAAIAYYEATGKRSLLDVMEKSIDCIYNEFIVKKRPGCPGHPEIELALMKMHDLTGSEKALELAEHFINERGQSPNCFVLERQRRGIKDKADTNYMQASEPVRDQKDAIGHAVRAVYLYTAMAHLAAQTSDESLLTACKRLWNSITQRRMYVTGGIGSTERGESFTEDYDLPGDTAYCETCASIGLIFFASRMLENDVDGKYADVLEKAFYNTVLAGMQLDGQRFFYVNPLRCVPGITGKASTHKHVLTQRVPWYPCACCPPNLARLIASFGKYAYGENDTTAFCHLYAAGEVKFKNGLQLKCETHYPYGFDVRYTINDGEGTLALRIPSWSEKFTLTQNSKTITAEIKKGYIYLPVKKYDKITLTLESQPYFVYPSPKIPTLCGKVCICRGPLVYCFEGADNGGEVLPLKIDTTVPPRILENPGIPHARHVIAVKAKKQEPIDSLYTRTKPAQTNCEAYAVPYYLWGNRGENEMSVWI